MSSCGSVPANCSVPPVCFDMSSCDSQSLQSSQSSQSFQWFCPSMIVEDNIDVCMFMKYYGWHETTIDDSIVLWNSGNVPLFPSIINDRCRDRGASDYSRPHALGQVNSSNVTIIGDGSINRPYETVSFESGIEDTQYVYSAFTTDDSYAPMWWCVSPTPCQAGQDLMSSDGTRCSGKIYIEPSNYLGPPTSAELLKVCKCV